MKKTYGLYVLVLILNLFLVLAGSPSAQAAAESRYITAGIENAAAFENSFRALQAAVAANDKVKMMGFILYPLRVNGWLGDESGKNTAQFSNRSEVLENFDEIFTVQIKEAILKQKVESLFVNWQGVMVGKGEVWLSGSDKSPARYGIIAVNLSM